MADNTMALVRFSNQNPSLFNRFFENDLFDWSNRNYSNTNTTLPSVNIKEIGHTPFFIQNQNLAADHDVLMDYLVFRGTWRRYWRAHLQEHNI
jgi:hypothetical protein